MLRRVRDRTPPSNITPDVAADGAKTAHFCSMCAPKFREKGGEIYLPAAE